MKNFVQKGDNVTVVESVLVHPTHSDGLVDGGDQIVCHRLVGVANFDALASTDNIVISTRGVFSLPVTSIGNGLSIGETVFIDPSTAALSEDSNDTPFGIALDTVTALATKTIPIRLFGATPWTGGAGS
jgi:predicted RecA/RadA family phage recombinase